MKKAAEEIASPALSHDFLSTRLAPNAIQTPFTTGHGKWVSGTMSKPFALAKPFIARGVAGHAPVAAGRKAHAPHLRTVGKA